MSDPSRERLNEIARDFARGFIADVGYRVQHLERGFLESRLVVRERHRQQDGYIHAGVLAAMADHSAGYAAFTLVDVNQRILTVEFKINFLQPAFGETMICKSHLLREGGRILVGESEVFDRRAGEEVLAAKALVTLISVHRSKIKPVPGLLNNPTDRSDPTDPSD
jgi:uncharacterized protein (TIGR00369 family)